MGVPGRSVIGTRGTSSGASTPVITGGGVGSRIVDRIAGRSALLPNWESQLRPLTSFVSIDTNELDQHKLRNIPEGNRLNIGLFALNPGHYPHLAAEVTEERVMALFAHRGCTKVVRHDLPAERVRELAPRGMIFSGGPGAYLVLAKGWTLSLAANIIYDSEARASLEQLETELRTIKSATRSRAP